jgi:acetyl-CoA C-acetyltransferase
MLDSLLNDGLWDPFENWGMGNAAEFIAKEYDVSREEMDQYSVQSHLKAIMASQAGSFINEIAPVLITDRKGAVTVISADEGPRADTSLAGLAKLKPSFNKDGRVTAGNASTLNDGAAAVVIASQAYAQEHSLDPIARVVATAQVAVEPKFLFAAPAQAIPLALSRSGWKLTDLDLIELNEAFAAQVLANGKELTPSGWDWDKVNVNGGGISLGHPLGASGTRVLVSLVHALRARNLTRGIACLCLGGGEAVAMTIEIDS